VGSGSPGTGLELVVGRAGRSVGTDRQKESARGQGEYANFSGLQEFVENSVMVRVENDFTGLLFTAIAYAPVVNPAEKWLTINDIQQPIVNT
jgi:hypothetical protein